MIDIHESMIDIHVKKQGLGTARPFIKDVDDLHYVFFTLFYVVFIDITQHLFVLLPSDYFFPGPNFQQIAASNDAAGRQH